MFKLFSFSIKDCFGSIFPNDLFEDFPDFPEEIDDPDFPEANDAKEESDFEDDKTDFADFAEDAIDPVSELAEDRLLDEKDADGDLYSGSDSSICVVSVVFLE